MMCAWLHTKLRRIKQFKLGFFFHACTMKYEKLLIWTIFTHFFPFLLKSLSISMRCLAGMIFIFSCYVIHIHLFINARRIAPVGHAFLWAAAAWCSTKQGRWCVYAVFCYHIRAHCFALALNRFRARVCGDKIMDTLSSSSYRERCILRCFFVWMNACGCCCYASQREFIMLVMVVGEIRSSLCERGYFRDKCFFFFASR